MGDHTETIDIEYDPEVTSYIDLLEVFWTKHDTTCETSKQYMSVVFYHEEEQKKMAEKTKTLAQQGLTKPIQTKIIPAATFINAEDYHQKYLLQRHPEFVESMGLKVPDLLKSHVAARLNGYAGGFGKVSDFNEEWEGMGLNAGMAQYTRNFLTEGSREKNLGCDGGSCGSACG